MKANLHPNWNHNCVVTCGCGNTFVTGSGADKLQVDICQVCHPFYTGEDRFVDRLGRVDSFLKKIKLAEQSKSPKKMGKKTTKTEDNKSYQQILQEQKSTLKKASVTTA